VLHTWGSALTHHPHVHMIVPGGGISLDGERWVSCRPGFVLPVRVLSRLFRRLFLQKLIATHQADRLSFFGNYAHLAEAQSFAAYLAPLRKAEAPSLMRPASETLHKQQIGRWSAAELGTAGLPLARSRQYYFELSEKSELPSRHRCCRRVV
jgi:hypothetical protein